LFSSNHENSGFHLNKLKNNNKIKENKYKNTASTNMVVIFRAEKKAPTGTMDRRLQLNNKNIRGQMLEKKKKRKEKKEIKTHTQKKREQTKLRERWFVEPNFYGP
jgi:hypothetical protein